MTQEQIDRVEAQYCSFLDDSGNIQWARLIEKLGFRAEGIGEDAIVEFKGERLLVSGLMSSFPLPSVNLIPGCVLDSWTAGIEREVLDLLA